jgi:hypothetical protein
MLDAQIKATIDAMSKADLWAEMVKGSRSQFQGDRRDYLMARFHLLDEAEHEEKVRRAVELAAEAGRIAKACTSAAEEANRIARISNRRASIALVVAALAVLIAIAGVALPHYRSDREHGAEAGKVQKVR